MSWHTNQSPTDREVQILKEYLGKTTCHFIGEELRPLYVNALVIYNTIVSDRTTVSKLTSLHDLLMPLAYALEATLFKLADELGIEHKGSQTIGQVFSQQKISDLAATIDSRPQQRVISEQLGNLSGFIQEYRNNSIHNGEGLAIENVDQLANKLGAIFDRIKSLIESLEKSGLVKVPGYTKPAVGSEDNWG